MERQGVGIFGGNQFKDNRMIGTYDYFAHEQSTKPIQVLEYCLFQPGFFTDYFAYPHRTSPHFHSMQMLVDFENRRAIIMAGSEDAPVTVTSVSDMASVVAAALDYPKPWPRVGGIRGTQTTMREILALGDKLRGPFEVTRLEEKDVQNGEYETPWYPVIDHPGVPVEMREVVSKGVLREYLLGLANGEWSVSDEWNTLLDIHLTSMDEFLGTVWKWRGAEADGFAGGATLRWKIYMGVGQDCARKVWILKLHIMHVI